MQLEAASVLFSISLQWDLGAPHVASVQSGLPALAGHRPLWEVFPIPFPASVPGKSALVLPAGLQRSMRLLPGGVKHLGL